MSASYKMSKPSPFISAADNEILKKWKVPSFEVQVGLHLCLEPGVTEIFGHEGAEAEDIKYAH